jgi:Xaa-Pro aminopeptidase
MAAMMEAGAEGPGFWPWVKSGSSAYLPGLFVSFFDYHALNHVMAEGEMARVNLGAEYGMYKGDYGRTFPVGAPPISGKCSTCFRTPIWRDSR